MPHATSSPAPVDAIGPSSFSLDFLEVSESELPHLMDACMLRSVEVYRHVISQMSRTAGRSPARDRMLTLAQRNLEKVLRELHRRGLPV